MGLVKSSKVGTIRDDAMRGHREGRTVFVARYWDEIFSYQGTGSISGAAEAIEAVESAGWALTHMAYSWVERKNRGVTILMFRRQ